MANERKRKPVLILVRKCVDVLKCEATATTIKENTKALRERSKKECGV